MNSIMVVTEGLAFVTGFVTAGIVLALYFVYTKGLLKATHSELGPFEINYKSKEVDSSARSETSKDLRDVCMLFEHSKPSEVIQDDFMGDKDTQDMLPYEDSKATTSDDSSFNGDNVKENPERDELLAMVMNLEDDTNGFYQVYSDKGLHNLVICRKDETTIGFPYFRVAMEVEGVTPWQMSQVFSDERIHEQPQWSEAAISCEKLFEDKHCNVYRTLADGQILTNREFIDKKYSAYDPDTESYFIIFETANDHPVVLLDYPETPDVVRGANYLGGYIFRPLDNGREGTKYLCITQTTIAGNVPNWLVNRFAHKALAKFASEITKRASIM